MDKHSLFCLRGMVLTRAAQHINLSTSERDLLFSLEPAGSPCCNCKRLWERPEGRVEMGQTFSVAGLTELTVEWVMDRRKANHPAGGRAESWRGMDWAEVGRKLGLSDSGEGAQIIRIDFKNRRRII